LAICAAALDLGFVTAAQFDAWVDARAMVGNGDLSPGLSG